VFSSAHRKVMICTVLCLALHVAACAGRASAVDGEPRPIEALDQSEIARTGLVIDSAGILFTSGASLLVPAVPGVAAAEGPRAGSEPGKPPTYREAVP
jgi:hypothetical protein